MEVLLDAYTDFLMICPGQASATFMSDILEGSVSHDQITRLLSSGKVDTQALWKMVKPICHEIQSSDGVLIIDDSILPKPHSRINGLVCWHYDHTKGRTVKSINFLSAIYHSQQMSVPVGIETVIKDQIYTDNKGKVKRKNTISKHKQFQSLVAEATGKMPVQYVLADTWYSSADNMNYIVKGLRTNFILGCKENRRIALSLEDKKAGRYQLIKNMAPEEHACTVWLEQLDFPVVLIRQVFIHEDGSCGILYLVSSDLRLDSEQIAMIYQRRWKVEEFYKSVKGNASMGNCPAWKIVTQSSHLIASVMAFVKLEVLKERHKKNHFAIKKQLFRYAARAAWQNLGHLQFKTIAA
jgi:hypothetical protein